jgi:hypothetical protein
VRCRERCSELTPGATPFLRSAYLANMPITRHARWPPSCGQSARSEVNPCAFCAGEGALSQAEIGGKIVKICSPPATRCSTRRAAGGRQQLDGWEGGWGSETWGGNVGSSPERSEHRHNSRHAHRSSRRTGERRPDVRRRQTSSATTPSGLSLWIFSTNCTSKVSVARVGRSLTRTAAHQSPMTA